MSYDGLPSPESPAAVVVHTVVDDGSPRGAPPSATKNASAASAQRKEAALSSSSSDNAPTDAVDTSKAQVGFSRALILALSFLSALSGLLFGYDASAINDALPLMRDHFGLSSKMEGTVVSTLLLGAIVGSLFAGFPADRFGRKITIIVSAVLFCIGCTLASYAAVTVGVLIFGRLVIGIALGITSAVTPARYDSSALPPGHWEMYIAEMSPASYRGGLVMLYQLSITMGILISLGIGHALYASGNWELMVFLATAFAVLQIIGMIFVPESPRFFCNRGRMEEALAALIRIRGDKTAAQAELAEMVALHEEEAHVSWSNVFSPAYRGPMLAGIGLAVISAFDGINAFMYYSTKIFRLAGQTDPTLASLAVGITNFGASVIALYIVNGYGRRPLMFIGSVGQLAGLTMGAVAILQAGTGAVTETAGWVLVAGLLLFVVNFAYSSGPLTWVVISEVFPMRARGKGAGVATACNWLANYIIALIYPIIVGDGPEEEQRQNVGWTLVAFGAVVLVSFGYIYKFVPETHLKTLEEIERFFALEPEEQAERRAKKAGEVALAEKERKGKGKGAAGGSAEPV